MDGVAQVMVVVVVSFEPFHVDRKEKMPYTLPFILLVSWLLCLFVCLNDLDPEPNRTGVTFFFFLESWSMWGCCGIIVCQSLGGKFTVG